MVESGPAVAYARWCTARSNHKVPRYVKKQAKQFLDIVAGKDVEAHIDERAYARICNLLRIMVHPDIGKSLYDSLEDYAWLLITAVFCVKDNENRRYYNTAVLEIARKNFKTFNAAIIFILLMLTEPQFSRFFSVAPDLKLSSELKLAIRKIIKSSPLLADDGVFRVLRSEIRCKLTDSEYTPLAYSQDRMDGKLANAFLADEAGAMDSYPIEAMRSSQITLKSKLGIIICTCGGYIHGCRLRQSTCGGFAGIHRFVCAVTRFLIGEIKSEYFGCIAGIVRAEQNTELHILHVSSRAAAANDKHICVYYIYNLSFSLRCRCF